MPTTPASQQRRHCRDIHCGTFAAADSDWCKRHRPIHTTGLPLITVDGVVDPPQWNAEEAWQRASAALGAVKSAADGAKHRTPDKPKRRTRWWQLFGRG